jgi:GDP-mannose 6-dehydrogenase
MIETTNRSRVAVMGLGYVGCVTAACLADLGHKVIGVDRDTDKVHTVLQGGAPFFEPGLEEIVASNTLAGRLTATTDTEFALRDADIVLVCVGTPSERNGNLSLDQLRRVCQDIAAVVQRYGATRELIVAIRSTVLPGTCEEEILPALGELDRVNVVSNPEFLREGNAVHDFMKPSLVVVGSTVPEAAQRVAMLYEGLGVEPSLVSLRTAEMIKYACNAFHALKISFANEIGALCAPLGVPALEVMETLCRDTKLNISSAYLRPGFAFGGSCLPKDLRALNYRAIRMDLRLPLIESILESNTQQLQRGVEAALDLRSKRIGVYGLSFKENTDDLRESPVVLLLEQLLGRGCQVRVYDPHIKLDNIYGSNRNYLLSVIPHIGALLSASLEDMLSWADDIIITQRPPDEVIGRFLVRGVRLLDIAGVLGDCATNESPAPQQSILMREHLASPS